MALLNWQNMIFLLTFPCQIHCFLKINYFPIEGETAEIECTSHEISNNKRISWINPQSEIVSNCTFPGYCTIPTHPRFQVTGRNGTSTLHIDNTNYEMDDGIWQCAFNTYQSSGRLYIISKPTNFDFFNPPPTGISISEEGILLNGKADCVYPKPEYIYLKYRIKGDKEYNNFRLRKPSYQDVMNTSLCREHETSINITFLVKKIDFLDVNVFFKFSNVYTTLSGHTFITTSAVDITFPGDSTACPLNPCQHNGTCLESGTCNCLPNFTGMFCEEEMNNESTTHTTYPATVTPTVSTTQLGRQEESESSVAIIVMAVIVFVFICGIVACIYWKKYTMKCVKSDTDNLPIAFENECYADLETCQENPTTMSTAGNDSPPICFENERYTFSETCQENPITMPTSGNGESTS